MSSIDWGTLALGTVIGVGCQEQLKSAAKVTANLAGNLALATAEAVTDASDEINRNAKSTQTQANGKNG